MHNKHFESMPEIFATLVVGVKYEAHHPVAFGATRPRARRGVCCRAAASGGSRFSGCLCGAHTINQADDFAGGHLICLATDEQGWWGIVGAGVVSSGSAELL